MKASAQEERIETVPEVNEEIQADLESLITGVVPGSEGEVEDAYGFFRTTDPRQSLINPTKVPGDVYVDKEVSLDAAKETENTEEAAEVEEAVETGQLEQGQETGTGEVEDTGVDDIGYLKEELAQSREQTSRLIALLNDSAAGRNIFSQVGVEQEADEIVPTQFPTPQAALPQPPPFQGSITIPQVDDDTLTEIVNSPEAFNKYMQNVVGIVRQQATQEATIAANERVFVENTLYSYFSAGENADILPLKDLFLDLAKRVEQSNPNMPLESVLMNSGNLLREKLNLSKQLKGGGQSNGGVVRRRRDGKPIVEAPIRSNVPTPGPKRTVVNKQSDEDRDLAELLGFKA